MSETDHLYLTAAQVRKRYGGVSNMWIFRKTRDVGFPAPATRFGGSRRFWCVSDLVKWESVMIQRGAVKTAVPKIAERG